MSIAKLRTSPMGPISPAGSISVKSTWIFQFTRFCTAGFLLVLSLLPAIESSSFAAETGSRNHLVGFISAGFGPFNVLSPGADIRMNNGQMFSLQGEKSFGFLHLYLEAELNYLKTTGNLNYNYTSSSVTYTQANVNYALDEIQGGFGLRLKILENSPIRPYIEGGILGGYFQLTYDSSLRTPSMLATGSDFKSLDSVLDFGTYGEVGFEIGLTSSVGVKIADRYSESTTRPISTLKNQMVRYTTNIYLFSIFTYF